MNWGLFALAVSAALFAGWLVLAFRRRWSPVGLIASFACLLAAALNSAAPFRGAVDPAYMGYVFGYLTAEKGLAVTLLAGPVLLGGVAAAYIAVTRRSGPLLWVVSAVCGALAIILGGPWLRTAITDPASNSIQFGEYLTVPGLLSTALLFVLLILPFVTGAIWAARGAVQPRAA
ncbi:hypothetical protein P7B02_14115 [Caulobacter segnis]|uniref:hypothetical protein n=1 Tax=Caulobacter segnis TaxID=88688 RepID=UPI00240FBF21|nr:hypothetical protein [Caulobacter segnis]MDG2522670.1 hypothetical protein [Caulobacter segnis]